MVVIVIVTCVSIPLLPLIFFAALMVCENYIVTIFTTIVLGILAILSLRLIVGEIAYLVTGNDDHRMDPKWPGVVAFIWLAFALIAYALECMEKI
jgi:hypothetical protein